jgi:hypothetical protein
MTAAPQARVRAAADRRLAAEPGSWRAPEPYANGESARCRLTAEATIHLAPLRRPARPGAVPDVRGLFYPVRPEAAGRYGLLVRVLRLTERPMAVDGLVADRDCPQRRELALVCPLPHRSCGSKPGSWALSRRPYRRSAGLILIRPSPAA